jgi:hypothetical protein
MQDASAHPFLFVLRFLRRSPLLAPPQDELRPKNAKRSRVEHTKNTAGKMPHSFTHHTLQEARLLAYVTVRRAGRLRAPRSKAQPCNRLHACTHAARQPTRHGTGSSTSDAMRVSFLLDAMRL